MEDMERARKGKQIETVMYEDNVNCSGEADVQANTFQIGMNFTSFEDLYQAYNRYAVSKGFGVRIAKKTKNKTRITGGFIYCACEGESEASISYEERQRERLVYRCHCKARMKYKLNDGVYTVVQLNDIHNHPMVDADKRQFIQSNRRLTSATKRIIDSMVDVGVGPAQTYRYLSNQAGGSKNVGCIEQDVHNYQQSRRRKFINGGDAQALIDYLSAKKSEDSNFYYNFKLDDEGRLCNVFWRDSLSKAHYECFGDVMTFDTTYRTNKWNMVFAPFVGFNNHWQNIYFGCAFLHDESIPSFEWLFKCFLESMDGKQPRTLFTDQDHAMAAAIRNVVPNARHRLCGWHIEKNAVQNIPHLMAKPDFRDKFNTLLWSCKSESEYEYIWNSMIAEWNLGENKWLKRLHNLRGKWCPGFSRDTFSCNVKSTQRGESANRVFSKRTCQAKTLIEFIHLCEEKVLKVRDDEALSDTRTRGMPEVKVSDCGMLTHAATVYTRTIFAKFQAEFLQCLSDWAVEKTTDGVYDRYTIYKENSDETFIVLCEPNQNSIFCSCHLFDKMGLLCCHALRVMHTFLRMKSIPECFILKRWTKKAKQGSMFEQMVVDTTTAKSTATTRLNYLMKESFCVMSVAAHNDITVQIGLKYLNAAREEIFRIQNDYFDNADDGMVTPVGNKNHASVSNVLDPVNKRKKGQRNVRLKSNLEKKKPRTATKKKGVTEDNNIAMGHASQLNNDTDSTECFSEMEMCDDHSIPFTQLMSQVDAGMPSGTSSHCFESVTGNTCFAYKCCYCGEIITDTGCRCMGARNV